MENRTENRFLKYLTFKVNGTYDILPITIARKLFQLISLQNRISRYFVTSFNKLLAHT